MAPRDLHHSIVVEALVKDELVKAGVPKEDIVLAFQPEDVRPHTGFAVR